VKKINTFYFKNKNINYCDNILSTKLIITERRIELPLVKLFLELYNNKKDLVEIGCVTPYFLETTHKVYDLKDNHNKCIHKNASEINLNNLYLLSISTVEHFDVGDYNIKQSDFLDPYDWIINCTNNTNKYLITFPIGFNIKLDNRILNSNINVSFLSRDSEKSKNWIQKEKNQLTDKDIIYDKTFQTCANTLAVLENFI
jgi:hypothetical protein